MSLVFMDSFDHYSSANLGQKWDVLSVTGGTNIDTSGGRRGTQSFIANINPTRIGKIVCGLSCYIVGFAYKQDAGLTTTRSILNFNDGTISHLDLAVSTDDTLYIRRSGTTVLSSYSLPIAMGTYYYIEMKAEISNSISAGGVEVKLNGVSIMTLAAGVDTQNAGSAEINRIHIGTNGVTSDSEFFDDLYIIDTKGAEASNFLGDVRIDALRISATGTVSNWSPSSAGATLVSMISDTAPNSNVNYMFASAASAAARWTHSALVSANGSIYGVQLNLNVAKSDSTSAKSVAGLFFSGSVSGVGSTTLVGNTSYTYVTLITSADASGVSWSSNTITNTEFGIKIVA